MQKNVYIFRDGESVSPFWVIDENSYDIILIAIQFSNIFFAPSVSRPTERLIYCINCPIDNRKGLTLLHVKINFEDNWGFFKILFSITNLKLLRTFALFQKSLSKITLSIQSSITWTTSPIALDC